MRAFARSKSMQAQGMRLGTLAVALGLTGCVTTGGGVVGGFTQTVKNTFASDDPCSNNGRNIGTVVGLGVGVLVATQLDKDVGKVAAVVAGGWVGNLIGADIDRKRCEISKIAKQNDLAVAFQSLDVGSKEGDGQAFSMQLRDSQGEQAQFERNSDRLTPRAQTYFRQIAEQYAQHAAPPANASAAEKKAWDARVAQRKLLLIGHTDDTGSSATNAALSEKRARAVADLLARSGVSRQQMYFQGAGEGYPLASNATEEGRAQNRRVEFVEVYGEEALTYYLDNRRANYALYRPAAQDDAAAGTLVATDKAAPVAAASRAGKAAERTAAQSAARVAQRPAATSAATASKSEAVEPVTPADKRSTASSTVAKPVLDFGGELLQANTRMVNLGATTVAKPGFSLLPSAHAASGDVFIARCDQDRPRTIGAVKSLDSGKAYRTHEHLKGLHGASWAQMLNGHLVVLHKVAVLRDGTAAQNPEVRMYANYNPDQRKTAKPTWSGKPDVNVYQGDNGLLFRMFLGNNSAGAGVQCMDVLFPPGGDAQAKDGKLIYGPASQLYAADFKPAMQP